ncbi:MAG TPA: FG-GAP-like repeat-containing protein [Bryobacteraceae bacterium]|nr:FG-GAP-like repeat-containing protein [Bryobacteraceae bacterium]
MADRVTRRRFLEGAAVLGLWEAGSAPLPAAPFPVHFRRSHPYEALFAFVEPGHDAFEGEKVAAEITAHLERLPQTRSLPLSPDFQGVSPMPARYRTVAEGVERAEFDPSDQGFERGLGRWLDSLGQIRAARFFVLPGENVRYEIAGTVSGGLRYRVGLWKQSWSGGRLVRFEPIEETVTASPTPLFRDVTSAMFGAAESFQSQLLRGVTYWRARLDSACGIDVYGNNGIAVGDIDGDGWDEVYVCQPGGLPNRLYKRRADGTFEDITARAGVGVLDNTACALFLDLRNIGRQDLVVATTDTPLLFLNRGDGTFQHKPGAFRFASPPQGAFTGMAAADYDRDGRMDLYVCSYIYFQSEDQYRYPTPYYDSRNGPPNFLFRNQLTPDGEGFFEDVTARAGLAENNDRYSFAAAWCDFDGNGWPDLYVANDFGRNNLYRNDQGRFRDVAETAGVADVGPGMSAAWFDYDGDGREDVYVSNMWTACGQRVVEDAAFVAAADGGLREQYRRHSRGNSLYRNRGDGNFEPRAAAEGVEMGRWAWASDGLDFDNDGAPEIYVTCGMLTNPSETDLMSFFWRQVVARSPAKNAAAPDYENGWNALNQLIRADFSWNGREPNVLYARRGGRYYDFSGVSGLDAAEDSRAFAATDLDGDGSLDLLVKNRLGPQVRAFRNEWGTRRRSLALDLRGTRSNRDAIGARVEIEHAGGRTVRTLAAGSGYLSQHTKRLHFGLGESEEAKARIHWPSGLVQEFAGLAAGFRYQIVEGSDEVKRAPFLPRSPIPTTAAARGENRPESAPAWLIEPAPLPEPRKGPALLCLYSGRQPDVPRGLPFQMLALDRVSPDVAAGYALFRTYLFDYRAGLSLPMLLLVDERGLARKFYPEIPPASVLEGDLRLLRVAGSVRQALPFPGEYYAAPHRNHFRMGAAFYWAGYPEQALIYLNEVLRQTPANSKAHLAIGHIHLEAGRYGPAREHLERAAVLNPRSADAWINLGSLESAEENHAAALADFEKALAITPESTFALISAGRAQGKLGRAQAAQRLLERALELEPKNAEAANQLGLLFAGQNRMEEAVRCFQEAIAAQRNHAGAINNLGVLYMRMQKPRDAIAAFRYGMEVAPDEEVFYLNLARAYVATGDRAKARDILQQLLTRRPDSTMGKKGLAELGAP